MNRVALSCLPSACPQSFGKPCAKRNGGDFLRNIDRLSQGGILAGNQGARFPRNLQTHTKFLQHFTLFLHKFDFKVRISCYLKIFFQSHTCMKYFLVTRRNFLALKLIICQMKKFIVTERNLLSRAEIYCHKKKFFVAGRNFLSHEEINFLS